MQLYAKYTLPLLAATGLGCLPLRAATPTDDAPARAFFLKGQTELQVPYLPDDTRLDILDYYAHNLPSKAVNSIGTVAAVLSEQPRLLVIQPADSVVIAYGITATPAKRPVAVVVETLPLPALDSSVKLYDQNWNPLKKQPVVEQPLLEQWLTPEGAAHRAEIEAALPFITAEASFNPANDTLTWRNTVADAFLTAVEAAPEDIDMRRIIGWLRPEIVYRWTGSRFELQKP